MSDFAERLKSLRASKHWSQEELAKRLHVSRSKIGNYEQGTRKPRYDDLTSIAKVFDVPPSYFLDDQEMIRREILVEQWDFSDEELSFMDQVRKLNEKGLQKLENYLNDLLDLNKYTEWSD